MNRIKETILGILGLGLLAGFFILGSDVMAVAPGNAQVVLDNKFKTFTAPTCMSESIDYKNGDFELSTFQHARDINYTEDSSCTSDEMTPSRGYIFNFISTHIGWKKPLSEKWNDDGTWNY